MLVSLLFVPFDAAIQHYRRNATHGVKGYDVEQDKVGQKRKRSGDQNVESAGSMYEFRPVKQLRLAPQAAQSTLEKELKAIIEHAFAQIASDNPLTYQHPYVGTQADVQPTQSLFDRRLASRGVSRLPHVVFLSEQPGELVFPDMIELNAGRGQTVIYKLLGKTGTKAPQRIYGYHRFDLGGDWASQSVIKKTAPFNVDENVLIVKWTFQDQICCFAGVHLSAKNTKASRPQRQKIMQELAAFCQSQRPPVQFVVGDFNIDVHADGFEGHVGARPGSTVFMAPQMPAPMGVRYQEQYSNSTNSEHFMGHLVVDPNKVLLRGHRGLSLQRSRGGNYFSDHPPIYVELEFQ
jgi:hypothetical protein